jgi:tetratricopeptide (TPR) repeat protein
LKKAIIILIVLIIAFLYYGGFLTKKETLPFSKEFFTVETPPSDDRPLDLKGIWVSKSQGSDKKTPAKSTKELDQLYQLKLDKGIRNLPILSTLLSREARKARERGDSDQAMALASYSVKLSPDLPPFYFELAKALWSQSPFQLHKIFPEVFKGLLAQFQHYPSSVRFFYNFFFILCNAILMTFVVFGIVVMAKYLSLYFYDIRRSLAQKVSGLLINSAKIFVLFIPFFLRLDILWAIMFWSIFLWGYMMKRERHVLLIFFILLVYLPFFLRSASTFLDGPPSEVLVEMSQANHENWDKTVEQKLEAWLSTHPDDPEVLFTLGLIGKREGRFAQAEEWYRKSTQQAPQFHEALSNLGNVYLAKKQPDLAIASYQQAVDLDPNKGAYYYNLYRAYSQETFLTGKTSKAFEKARQLDPKLVDYYSAIDSSHYNRMVIDEVLTLPRLWKRSLDQFIGREGVLYRLFKAWFEKIPSRIFLVPLFFLGLLIGVSRYSRAKRFLSRCPMCGSPTYRFYLGTSDQESICFNCHRIFIQKEKIHPRIQEKKSLQASQFQKTNHFVSRFLSFFFVGFSDVWRGQSFKGVLSLFLFFIFIFRFVYWNGALTLLFPQSPPIFLRGIFWGGLFILFYILSIRRVYRLKPKYEIEKIT